MKEEPKDLWLYENEAFSEGFETVCGVDEAGRGPLAGPVCAAAVILPKGLVIDGLNDSKKLTDKKRRELYDVITQSAVSYGIAMATEQEIDEINILQATFLAMQRALDKLAVKPDLALIDGNRAKDVGLPVRTIVKGFGGVHVTVALRDEQRLAHIRGHVLFGLCAGRYAVVGKIVVGVDILQREGPHPPGGGQQASCAVGRHP